MGHPDQQRIPEPAVPPTFERLCELEPKLQELAREAQGSRCRSYHAVLARWYCELRPRLLTLVGFGSSHPEPLMHTSAAYDVGYDHVFALLNASRRRQKRRRE
jgi:hypothetical protein